MSEEQLSAAIEVELNDLYRHAPEIPEAKLVAMILDPEGLMRRDGTWPEFKPFDPDLADFVAMIGRMPLTAHRHAHLQPATA